MQVNYPMLIMVYSDDVLRALMQTGTDPTDSVMKDIDAYLFGQNIKDAMHESAVANLTRYLAQRQPCAADSATVEQDVSRKMLGWYTRHATDAVVIASTPLTRMEMKLKLLLEGLEGLHRVAQEQVDLDNRYAWMLTGVRRATDELTTLLNCIQQDEATQDRGVNL